MDSKDFTAMNREEKLNLVQQIDAAAEEVGLDLEIELYRETVCALVGQGQVTDKQILKAGKELPSTENEKVKLFNEKVKPFTNGLKGVEVNVVSKLAAGDMFQTIEDVMPCFGGNEKTSIQHNQGEVLFVDFWATWCPPCQRPMAHNQEMLEKRAADWGGKVRIVGVSIDNTKDAVVKHVEDKKWTSVEHYHRHESQCSKVYGVQGVPHVLLVDTHGRIVFKGHPATRKDLEADFDTLLKGEPLTGEGAWVEGAAADKQEDDGGEPKAKEGFKFEYDAAAIEAQIDSFKSLAEGWIQDEKMKEKTKGFYRLFCVMTHNEEYDRKTKTFQGKFCNHRVLVGPKAKIEEFKAIFDENVKGDFQVLLRDQAVDEEN